MIQIAICDDSEVSLQNLNQAVTDILTVLILFLLTEVLS